MNAPIGLNLIAARKVDASSLWVIHEIYREPVLTFQSESVYSTISGSNFWFKQSFKGKAFLFENFLYFLCHFLAHKDNWNMLCNF
jgi:hypothetical protein